MLLPKFSIATTGEINAENRPPGHDESTFLDKMNRILIENDLHYSKFKFERQSNFKYGVVNTLGLFENTSIFKKISALLAVICDMYAGRPLKLAGDEEEKKAAEESKEPSQGFNLESVLFDQDDVSYNYCGVEYTQLASKLTQINDLLKSAFSAYQALNLV